MMNFNQLSDKISAKGYRRNAAARTIMEDNGTFSRVYDFEHRKKLDMVSVYLDEFGLVKLVEYTKINFDPQTRGLSQKVTRFDNDTALFKFLA